MRAAMITGIGSALAEARGFRRRLLARLVRLLYRVALRQVHVVFFQNDDDQQLFRDLGLVGPRQRLVRIAGSGIDLQEFTPTELPPPPVTFLMVARLLRDKGLHEYVTAAGAVKRAHPKARFQLLGPFDPNPEGITRADLDAIRSGGVVEYLGVTDDVRPFIAAAHVAVLPSYREGTPRSNLEAMGMTRPVITTDAPGCRETVEAGVSGLIVPARDAEALAAAMTELLEHPERLAAMGRAGRELAERRFDVREVNRTIMEAMGIPAAAATQPAG
jgi:glycosyltransferase involved in cell wall biosynthesis